MGTPDFGDILLPLGGVSLLILMVLISSGKDLMQTSSVKVNLPRANVTQTKMEEPISVTIDINRNVYVYNDPVSLDSLDLKIEQAFKAKEKELGAKLREKLEKLGYPPEVIDKEVEARIKSLLLLIRADKDLTWADVWCIIKETKQARARRVALAVLRKKKGGG